MLVIISGCSGVGKGTVINELLKKIPNSEFLKTCTTRKKRQSEEGPKEKCPYIFRIMVLKIALSITYSCFAKIC